MPDTSINGEQIKEKLREYCNNPSLCGLDAYVVKKESPKLKRMALSEETNEQGKTFRALLKDMFFEILEQQFLTDESEYADGSRLADNQHKYLIFEQGNDFYPFKYLSESKEVEDFTEEDLEDASGLVFCVRKGKETLWIYQHLWGIMVPNKKKTNCMARLMRFEDKVVFSEQRERLLTIARKIDIIILDNYLITNNTTLLQKNFGFQNYIYQSAQQTVQCIVEKKLVENIDKLSEYISRGKPKYAKKMMRISTSRVFDLSKEQLINKINTLPRWKGKFNFNKETGQIVLNTYGEVENLIDLFDERYTRSDVTDTEYDTDVKTIAQPTA